MRNLGIIFLVLALGVSALFAQQDASLEKPDSDPRADRVEQKIRMVDLMLNSPRIVKRMETTEDQMAKDLLQRAAKNFDEMKTYYQRGNYLEAEAIIDFVLRDLIGASQLLSAPDRKRNKYEKSLERLDSFALPVWKNLSVDEIEYLKTVLQQISDLREQADARSQAKDYEEAVQLINRAYSLKTSLINELDHEQTIVYDLVFDSIREEYDYLNKRTYHYLEMVELALAQRAVRDQTRKLVDDYVYRSVVNLQAAENFESENKTTEAIAALEKSLKQLTSVLKILGIRI